MYKRCIVHKIIKVDMYNIGLKAMKLENVLLNKNHVSYLSYFLLKNIYKRCIAGDF